MFRNRRMRVKPEAEKGVVTSLVECSAPYAWCAAQGRSWARSRCWVGKEVTGATTFPGSHHTDQTGVAVAAVTKQLFGQRLT